MKTVALITVIAAFGRCVVAAPAEPAGPSSTVDQLSLCPKPDEIKDCMSCLEVIRIVSKCDRCLESRIDQKKEAAKKASNADEFVKLMKSQKCNGTESNCGKTRSYVSEIFEGLASQYEQAKFDDLTAEGGIKTQNFHVKAAGLRPLFEKYAGSPNLVIHHLRFLGTHDHDWIVEQLPYGQGYRVYQSYHDAYSLLAWLSEGDLDSLFRPDDGEVRVWRTVQKQADLAVKALTKGAASLTNITAAVNDPNIKPFLPYLSYVINYDKDLVLGNFKKAWDQYGKGKIISKDQFLSNDSSSYISKLIPIVDFMDQNGIDSTTPFSKEVWDLWVDLFASPDPVYYPGMANNALAAQVMAGQKFRFEVKNVEIKGEPQCAKNAKAIFE